jgi:conjugal transfer pilus assembly protein TraI
MRTGMLAQILVGSGLLSELDGEVQAELFGAINPSMQPLGVESLLHKVVRQGVSTADEFDRKAQRAVFAPVQFDVPSAVHVAAELEPVIVTAPTPPQPQAPAANIGSAMADAPAASNTAPQPESQSVAAPPATPSQAAERTPAGPGPSPQTLHEALGITTAAAAPAPAAGAGSSPAVVDPSAMKAPAQPSATRPESSPPAAFDEVLKGVPNLVRELFQALRDDNGLVLPKRLVGGYGVSSSTLVEHMRKRSLMVADEATQITLTPRAGQLILDRPV